MSSDEAVIPPRAAASEVLRHNLLILVGLPSHIPYKHIMKQMQFKMK